LHEEAEELARERKAKAKAKPRPTKKSLAIPGEGMAQRFVLGNCENRMDWTAGIFRCPAEL